MYDRLKMAIEQTKLIDDHSHIGMGEYYRVSPLSGGGTIKFDVFRTPEESANGFPYLRELHYQSYYSLYGFTREDLQNPAKRTELTERYEKIREQDIDGLIDKAMEIAGVEKAICNYFYKTDGWYKGKKLYYIPSLDELCFPFDNSYYVRNRTLGKLFIDCCEYTLDFLKKEHAYEEKGFDNYLQFIDDVVARYVATGSPALKFVLAYERSTYFEKVPETEGLELYSKAQEGDLGAYTRLQDLIVWHIMRLAVKYDVPVQWHFAITDNLISAFDPLNLSNMIADPELWNCKIIILHGAYPRFGSAEALALGGLLPNKVYIDISGRIMFANHPKIVATMLRGWLEKPVLWDKIMYGSDTINGERDIINCARVGRDGVYYALAGMIDDDIIDEDMAITIAKKILRENAMKVYNLDL